MCLWDIINSKLAFPFLNYQDPQSVLLWYLRWPMICSDIDFISQEALFAVSHTLAAT